ncbi:hypothetical protein B0H16DRAFT_1332247, partial [Mycena metata]
MQQCPGCCKKGKKRKKSQDNLPLPEYRCRDCHGGMVYCQTCVVTRHLENPLHRVYIALADLNLRRQRGHSPLSCCTAPERAIKGFVVLHTNGIHEVNVNFCGCEGARAAGTYDIQLLRAGWFPATHERPQTAATFAVLNYFQQETCQAKTTMYDFYGVLEKLTGNTGVKPPDRYREWLRLCREYEHILLLAFGDRALVFDPSGVNGTGPG